MCKSILFKQVSFTTVHYKHLQAAAVRWYFQLKLIWSSDLTACLEGSNPDVLSSPSPDLCGSLYGLSNLASDGSYAQAVQESGNPWSGRVAEFRCWPLKWRFPWKSKRVMSDMRSYCCLGHQAAGDKTFHFSISKREVGVCGCVWVWGGASLRDLQPTLHCLLG